MSVRLTADALRVVADDQVIAEHVRRFSRDPSMRDLRLSLPILEKNWHLTSRSSLPGMGMTHAHPVACDRRRKAPRMPRVRRTVAPGARAGAGLLEVAGELTIEIGAIGARSSSMPCADEPRPSSA